MGEGGDGVIIETPDEELGEEERSVEAGEGGGSASLGGMTSGDAGWKRGAGGGVRRGRRQHPDRERARNEAAGPPPVGGGAGAAGGWRRVKKELPGRAAGAGVGASAGARPRLAELCRTSAAAGWRCGAVTTLPGGEGCARASDAARGRSVAVPRGQGGVCASDGNELSVRPVDIEIDRVDDGASSRSRVARSMSRLVQLPRWMGMGAEVAGGGAVVGRKVAAAGTAAAADGCVDDADAAGGEWAAVVGALGYLQARRRAASVWLIWRGFGAGRLVARGRGVRAGETHRA